VVKWFSSVIVITSNVQRFSLTLANYLTVGRLVKGGLAECSLLHLQASGFGASGLALGSG